MTHCLSLEPIFMKRVSKFASERPLTKADFRFKFKRTLSLSKYKN